ncbi:hypothetical protein [Olleya sp. HaHaR_3_96]|uniref:hypothetical protein n=1 Tax=Olleya sp. HaHaR_3_96 TaxID=2745560 RepID=UPI001C4F9128|nr:hypothetical protein [Olleya sp. HaHaR_3_96]QXP59521.1 hypothetical protein H0I26_16630 [Olleya sp. HaHaR_3_96]
MNTETLIYDKVVGYMLKIIKSGIRINKFKNKFNAIKHGDYVCFIELLKVGIPEDIIVNKIGEGIIPAEKQLEQKNVDFLFLLLASKSLLEFYKECYLEYGEIIDKDLSDKDFENLANFEMVLRMFYNNTFEYNGRIKIHVIIDKYMNHKGISEPEIKKVQAGRTFLNMVKGHKANFDSYNQGLITFNESLKILEKYKIELLP